MIVEVIRRCPYCKRENPAPASAFAQNPFCATCLPERIQRAINELGPVTSKRVGRYIEAIPVHRIGVSKNRSLGVL